MQRENLSSFILGADMFRVYPVRGSSPDERGWFSCGWYPWPNEPREKYTQPIYQRRAKKNDARAVLVFHGPRSMKGKRTWKNDTRTYRHN